MHILICQKVILFPPKQCFDSAGFHIFLMLNFDSWFRLGIFPRISPLNSVHHFNFGFQHKPKYLPGRMGHFSIVIPSIFMLKLRELNYSVFFQLKWRNSVRHNRYLCLYFEEIGQHILFSNFGPCNNLSICSKCYFYRKFYFFDDDICSLKSPRLENSLSWLTQMSNCCCTLCSAWWILPSIGHLRKIGGPDINLVNFLALLYLPDFESVILSWRCWNFSVRCLPPHVSGDFHFQVS